MTANDGVINCILKLSGSKNISNTKNALRLRGNARSIAKMISNVLTTTVTEDKNALNSGAKKLVVGITKILSISQGGHRCWNNTFSQDSVNTLVRCILHSSHALKTKQTSIYTDKINDYLISRKVSLNEIPMDVTILDFNEHIVELSYAAMNIPALKTVYIEELVRHIIRFHHRERNYEKVTSLLQYLLERQSHIQMSSMLFMEIICLYPSFVEEMVMESCIQVLSNEDISEVQIFEMAELCIISTNISQIIFQLINVIFMKSLYCKNILGFLNKLIALLKQKTSRMQFLDLYPKHLQNVVNMLQIRPKYSNTETIVHLLNCMKIHKTELVMLCSHYSHWFYILCEY